MNRLECVWFEFLYLFVSFFVFIIANMAHTITAVTVAAWVMPFVIQSHKRNTKCLVNDTYRTKAGQICKNTDRLWSKYSFSFMYLISILFPLWTFFSYNLQKYLAIGIEWCSATTTAWYANQIRVWTISNASIGHKSWWCRWRYANREQASVTAAMFNRFWPTPQCTWHPWYRWTQSHIHIATSKRCNTTITNTW